MNECLLLTQRFFIVDNPKSDLPVLDDDDGAADEAIRARREFDMSWYIFT